LRNSRRPLIAQREGDFSRIFPDAIGIRPDGREKLLAWSTFAFCTFVSKTL
jgi:hypothetical protein